MHTCKVKTVIEYISRNQLIFCCLALLRFINRKKRIFVEIYFAILKYWIIMPEWIGNWTRDHNIISTMCFHSLRLTVLESWVNFQRNIVTSFQAWRIKLAISCRLIWPAQNYFSFKNALIANLVLIFKKHGLKSLQFSHF